MTARCISSLIFTLILGLGLCQKLSALEMDSLIKTEKYFYLKDVKERPDLASFNLDSFLKNISKELHFDTSGRMIQEKILENIGPIVYHPGLISEQKTEGYTVWSDSMVQTEKITTFSYQNDTIIQKKYDEAGLLMYAKNYLENEDKEQVFESTSFRVTNFTKPGVFSKPNRSKSITYYNLSEEEQQLLIKNKSDTIPLTLVFINEMEEADFIKTTRAESTDSWPTKQSYVRYSDPKTSKSVIIYTGSSYEEIDLLTFPSSEDTLDHRIYQKIRVKFGHDKGKMLRFRPNQFIPGDTIEHQEWITLTPNDSTQIKSWIKIKGGMDIRKMDKHYLHGQLIKQTVTKLEEGTWKNYETRNYIRYKNYCLLEIDAVRRKGNGRYKNYFLSEYEYY